MKFAEELFRRRRDELTPEICKKCVDHVKEVENSYWKTDQTDQIIDEKMDKLEFSHIFFQFRYCQYLLKSDQKNNFLISLGSLRGQ